MLIKRDKTLFVREEIISPCSTSGNNGPRRVIPNREFSLPFFQNFGSNGLFDQRFCFENFLQFKVLSRVRDIRDQLAGLCERVEVVVESNPNSNDITGIQKAICSGYFQNTVSRRTF